MSKSKKVTPVRKPTQVETIAAGKEMAKKHLDSLPEGHGWASVEEYIHCYLVPMAIRRLEALDRDRKKRAA